MENTDDANKSLPAPTGIAKKVGDYFEYFARRFPDYEGQALAELVRITLQQQSWITPSVY